MNLLYNVHRISKYGVEVKMKLCFSTLGCTEMSVEEIAALANSYNIGGVEIRGISGVLNNAEIEAFLPENRERTEELFRRSGITPAVLGTSCAFHRAERLESTIEEGRISIGIAEALGIKSIRVFGDRLLPDDPDCTKRLIYGLSVLCGISDRVDVLLEVHGDFNTVEALRPVIEAMGSVKNFGLIWDIGHTHRSYGENWREFYGFARPYIRHIHIKDASDAQKALTLIGKGDIPIVPIVKALIADGYDGYFSLEWEKKWHPELPDMTCALDSFVGVMSRAVNCVN